MITEYFETQSAMNSFITDHGITKDKISFIGSIAGGRTQLSYWKS